MKKLFLTTAAMGMLLGGAVFGLSSRNTSAVKVSAESTEKDMAKSAYWKAEEGNFFEFENWYSSKLGFSFEFKSKTGTYKKAPFVLSIDGVSHATESIYAWQEIDDLSNRTGSVGKCAQIDEDGWYRYELLFADIPSSSVKNASATITSIMWNFNWGETYKNELLMRDMKVITYYSSDYSNDSVGVDKTGKTSLSRWDSDFPFVANWGNSGKGIFFEYKPIIATNRIPVKLRVRNGSSVYLSQWYINSVPADVVGKDFALGNGWRRYEVMPEDVFAIEANQAYATWEVFALEFQWGKPLEYGLSSLGYFGTIDSYTQVVTYSDEGTTTKAYVKTGDTAPRMISLSSSTDVFDGWYREEAHTNKYDFSNPVNSDLTLYANYVDADVVAVNTFVANYMHMDDVATSVTTDTGACKGENGYYALAKAALGELTNAQRKLFATADEYAEAYARLCAWATANGEELVINATTGVLSAAPTINSVIKNDNSMTVVLLSVASISLLGLAIALKKKKATR